MLLNFASIQLLWWRRARRSPVLLFAVFLAVAVGMWLERYMLVISSLFRDFLPSSWDAYRAPWTEWLLFLGSIGLFLFLFVLFLRFLPLIAISEMKEVLPEARAPAPSRPRPVPSVLAGGVTALHGTLACFDSAEQLTQAAGRAVAAGYRRLDAFTPFPVGEVNEALGLRAPALPWMVAGAGAAALAFGLWVLWYVDVVHFPTVVGGMPLAAWTAYGLPVFEFVVLLAATVAVVAMLALNRLPRLSHPLFAVPGFERATQNGFFLLIEASDPAFEPARVRGFLAELGPASVREVAA